MNALFLLSAAHGGLWTFAALDYRRGGKQAERSNRDMDMANRKGLLRENWQPPTPSGQGSLSGGVGKGRSMCFLMPDGSIQPEEAFADLETRTIDHDRRRPSIWNSPLHNPTPTPCVPRLFIDAKPRQDFVRVLAQGRCRAANFPRCAAQLGHDAG